VIMLYKQ